MLASSAAGSARPSVPRRRRMRSQAKPAIAPMMMSEMMSGGKPPQLVLRGHYHQFVREELWMADYHSTLVVTPAFAMLGDHAIQAVRSPSRVTNGMVAFEIIDGEVLQMYDFVRSIDVRTREVL